MKRGIVLPDNRNTRNHPPPSPADPTSRRRRNKKARETESKRGHESTDVRAHTHSSPNGAPACIPLRHTAPQSPPPTRLQLKYDLFSGKIVAVARRLFWARAREKSLVGRNTGSLYFSVRTAAEKTPSARKARNPTSSKKASPHSNLQTPRVVLLIKKRNRQIFMTNIIHPTATRGRAPNVSSTAPRDSIECGMRTGTTRQQADDTPKASKRVALHHTHVPKGSDGRKGRKQAGKAATSCVVSPPMGIQHAYRHPYFRVQEREAARMSCHSVVLPLLDRVRST